jgi:hypothetical protein
MAAVLLNPALTGDQASTNRDIKPPRTRFANAWRNAARINLAEQPAA